MLFKGRDRAALAGADAKAARLAVQMIFQDPYASLNPRVRVETIIGEAPRVPRPRRPTARPSDYVDRDDAPRRPRSRPQAALSAPVLRRPAQPHRHRPRARREARIPRLRRGHRRARRVDPGAGHQPVHGPARRPSTSPISSSATISASSQHISDRVVIMYLGRIVEDGADRGAVRASRTIPTRRRCSPRCRASAPSKRTFRPIKGEIPSPLKPPPGCHFHPRCPHAMERCQTEIPPLTHRRPQPRRRLPLRRRDAGALVSMRLTTQGSPLRTWRIKAGRVLSVS